MNARTLISAAAPKCALGIGNRLAATAAARAAAAVAKSETAAAATAAAAQVHLSRREVPSAAM